MTHRSISYLFFLVMLYLAAGGCRTASERSDRKKDEGQTSVAASDVTGTFLEAALQGDLSAVRRLVDDGIDPDLPGEGGRTALMLAAYNGHDEIVHYLLDHGADPNRRDDQGMHALIYAASGPFPNTVQLLLNHKADPNLIAHGDGWTALMFAAAEGQLEVVKVLLKHGADPAIREKDGDTAESFARKNGHTHVADYLKQYMEKKK